MNFGTFSKLVSAFTVLFSAPLFAQQAAPSAAKAAFASAATTTTVTTPGGTSGILPVFTGTSSIGNSKLYYANGNLGIGKTPAYNLDVSGIAFFGGQAVVGSTGTATSTSSSNSHSVQFQTSAYNSSSKVAVSPYLQFVAEASGNNTSAPSASLHLLVGTGTGGASESGLYFNNNGTIHFSSAQTFPIAAGPAGPAGPKGATGAIGPAGPKGATGSQGPSGSLALPYKGSGAGSGKAAFQATNTGFYTNTAPFTADGIAGYGGASGTVNYSFGGTGVVGYGGNATNSSSQSTFGGVGVVGHGGGGNPSGNSSDGGFGGEFYGGDGGGGTSAFGGDGIVAYGGSPNGVGLYVYAAGQTTANTAAVFVGAVDVYGTLYKSSGAFKIDHPVDPTNKYLVHSFVESPEMMNIYNGTVITDGRGEAVVTMPDYFEALNRDFRYQLTVMGQFAQAIVGSKIRNNYFVIKTDKPAVEVSWQVTGVRQDAWANAHRLPNEVEKDATEKGHFLHPELFGHPEDMSIGARRHSQQLALQQ